MKHDALITIVLVLITASACARSHPSDRAMEDQLLSREANFTQLVRIFSEDSHVNTIGVDDVIMEAGAKETLGEARLAAYRDLPKKLGLHASPGAGMVFT